MQELVNAYLLKEHNLLSEFVTLLRAEMALLRSGASVDLKKYEKILTFCRGYADQVHHAKEEDLLFTELYPISQIEGGPRCIYYKELQMQRPPVLEQVQDIQREMGMTQVMAAIEWKNQTREGHIVNPLLEEHVLGRQLLNLIEFEAHQRAGGLKKESGDLIWAIYRYNTMLEEHIEKENTCFANTVDRYLSVDIQKKIVEKFREMDEGSARETIQRTMNLFEDLKVTLAPALS